MNHPFKTGVIPAWVTCVTLCLMLSACTTRRAYRPIEGPTVQEHLKRPAYGPYQHTSEKGEPVPVAGRATECLERYPASNFWLGHVEMTEYGTYQSSYQMGLIERAVEEDTQSGRSLYKNGITIVVFVHGWFNNAEEGNDNLNHFRDLLSEVAAEQKEQRRGVLGVYLSWRGESLKNPLRYLTYWGRARTADMIGQGIMVEALARIKNIHWLVSAGADGRHESKQLIYKNSRLVLIGHSFGARALYGAVGGGMETNFLQPYWAARSFPAAVGKSKESEATMKLVPGFGDLVLLINPAMKSLPYRKLHYAMRSNATVNYDSKQPVLMMVLSSKNDVPNKSLLPIGETLGNRFRDWTAPPDERKEAWQNVNALGHYKDFHTHDLSLQKGELLLKKSDGFFKAVTHDQNGESFDPALPVKTLRDDKMSFRELGKKPDKGLLPFMIVSVDPKIINGHSGFWARPDNSHAYDFVKSFIAAQNQAVGEARAAQAAPAMQRVVPQAY